jgi:UrcA family protein
MRTSRSFLFGVLGLAALAGSAQLPAAADGRFVEQSLEVRYDDLDLGGNAGIAQLYGRLRSAAETVCDTGYRPQTLFLVPGWRACVTGALEQAVAEVDRPALTAYHAAQANRRAARGTAGLAARN